MYLIPHRVNIPEIVAFYKTFRLACQNRKKYNEVDRPYQAMQEGEYMIKKRFSGQVLAVILAVSLCGCGVSGRSQAQKASSSARTSTEAPASSSESQSKPDGTSADPIAKMEKIRSSIIANKDYYMSLSDDNPNTWSFKRMKDHTVSGSYETFKISDYNSCYADLNVTDKDKVI